MFRIASLPGKRKSRSKLWRNTPAAILMVTIAAAPGHAQDVDAPAKRASSASVDQFLYKGVIGSVLEAVPLEAEDRVQLQRGNAVVSNTLTGRSLALLLGLATPLMMVSGFVWGLWSAANIKSSAADLAGPSVSDAVLTPINSQRLADASEEKRSMEDAIRALILLGGGK
jgi:hypothetical protein